MNPDVSNGRVFPGICTHDAWVEFVIYEQGGWHPDGWERQVCPVNREKLRKIKKSAKGLAQSYPAGAQVTCDKDGNPKLGGPCAAKSNHKPKGHVPKGTKLLTVKEARSGSCFELMSHDNGLRLAVQAENQPFPASIAFAGGPREEKVSTFKIVPALTRRADAIS